MYIIGMHRDEMVLFKANVGMRVDGTMKDIRSSYVIGRLSPTTSSHWLMNTVDIFLKDWVVTIESSDMT